MLHLLFKHFRAFYNSCFWSSANSKLMAYIESTHPIAVIVWLTATILFSYVAVQGPPNNSLLLKMIIVVVSSQICIGVSNEYSDRFIDEKIKPWRPIPSGRISARATIYFAILSFFAATISGASLGIVGFAGALLGIGAGLAHNFGFKKSLFSWVPFVVGYSLHPIWIWILTGRFKPYIALLPILTVPLVIGIHLADQLPDLSESKLGVSGLVHRLGPDLAPKATLLTLICAPLIMLLPLINNILAYPRFFFVIGIIVYYLTLILGGWLAYSKRFTYRSMKIGFVPIEFGSLILVASWLISVT